MKTEVLLQSLDQLASRPGNVQIEAKDLKAVLDKVKSLERALADVLRLAYAKRKKLAA